MRVAWSSTHTTSTSVSLLLCFINVLIAPRTAAAACFVSSMALASRGVNEVDGGDPAACFVSGMALASKGVNEVDGGDHVK